MRRKRVSQRRLSMRKIRELLRLKYELGRSHRELAMSLGIANSTVSEYVRQASAAGISWPLPEGLDDAALEAALFPAPPPFAASPAGAGLGMRSSGASAPQGRDAAAVVAGVPGDSSEGLPVKLVLRATRRGGGSSTWSCGRSTGQARRRSSTTRVRSYRSWTGTPGRCAAPWSSSASSALRTTLSWT